MRRFQAISAVTALSLLMCSGVSAKSIQHCQNLSDPDYQAYCKASVSRSGFHCSAIENQNMRSTCRAQFDRAKAHCKATVYESDYIEVDEALAAACRALSRAY